MTIQYQLADQFIDPELEKSLLAALLQNPEQIYFNVIDYLSESTFSVHAKEFLLIANAIVDRKPLPLFENNSEPHPDPEAAAKRLAELYEKRIMAAHIQQFIIDLREGKSSSELKSMMESGLTEVEQAVRQLRNGLVTSLVDLLPEVLADLKKRRLVAETSGSNVVGLPTGFPKLDELLGGLPCEGALITIAAPPGYGKTSFALNVLRNVVAAGYPSLFCSFEETLPRLAAKCLASAAGLELKRFQDGLSDPSPMEEAARRFGLSLQHLYLHEGNHKTTLSEIKAKFLRIINKTGAKSGCIAIDYLQRSINSVNQNGEYRHHIDSYVGQIRELSIRLRAPIIMISAQNRASMGSGSLSSFRDSSSIEYSSDVAMFLVPDNNRMVEDPCRALSLVVAKNRFGQADKSIPLIFNAALGTFTEA